MAGEPKVFSVRSPPQEENNMANDMWGQRTDIAKPSAPGLSQIPTGQSIPRRAAPRRADSGHPDGTPPSASS
jgi:hypothetical protein